ncbi:MAG: phosphoenolpyruvate--protein phosphotransferase [Sphingomonas sp.]
MTITIRSPLSGWITPLPELPDPVFAERMLGDGIAIDPVEGRLVAPVDGVVSSIHPAKHAVTIDADGGAVLLLHIGLETVALAGDGFTTCVAPGQRVAAGDLLVTFDLDAIARRARSLVTPLVITNSDAFEILSFPPAGPVKAGEPLLILRALQKAEQADTPISITATREIRLPLAHGLHARPAARLAALAAQFDAQIELMAEGRCASARSPVAMLALALSHGTSLRLQGSGPQAAEAVAVLAELIESGMGELLPITAVPPAPPPPPPIAPLPSQLQGVAAVPGLAIGPAFVLRDTDIQVAENAADPGVERKALVAARAAIRAELTANAKGDGPHAAIAVAHLAFLDDPAVEAAAHKAIDAGKSAGFAWRTAIASFAEPLRQSNDRRFAERLDDLRDIERRVLATLAGTVAAPALPPPGAILIADELFPSQLMALAEAGLAGIATGQGGATSHVAIIAAGLDLPMITALGTRILGIEDGAELILDGDAGLLLIAPDAAILTQTRARRASRIAHRQAAQARAHEDCRTADGVRIEVAANLGSVVEAHRAVALGAEGCGLLRTEFLFLDRSSPPDEAEQLAAYQGVADALGDRPLIVRTLDIGADKPAPWLPMATEENPALGLRGIRLQLARPDLLETQLRALLRVRGAGPLRIMLPMVTDRFEVLDTRLLLDRLARELGVEAPELGIMVETPAAALMAAELAADSSFFSIGSNDLSQYALARDRTNPALAAGLDGLHPAVLRLIAETVKGARRHNRWVGLCGGLAAVPDAVPVLLGLGISELSVSPTVIAETKALVRTLDLTACRDLATRALASPDAAAVRALVQASLEKAA